MKKQCIGIKTAKGYDFAYESDRENHKEFRIAEFVQMSITGKGIPRAWKQLKMFKAAVKTFALNNDNPELDTPIKCEFYLKIKHGFIEDTFYLKDRICFIPKSLSYATSGHKETTKFISKAVDTICEHLGCTIEELKNNLEDL